jgi:hypothetical protein
MFNIQQRYVIFLREKSFEIFFKKTEDVQIVGGMKKYLVKSI